MWFIIWRGWGILVLPLSAVSAVPGILVILGLKALGVSTDLAMGPGMLVASVCCGLAIWFTAKALSSGPQRRLVDADSGRQYVLKRDAGSLFFIPMRFWAFIFGVPGVLFSLLLCAAPLLPPSMSIATPGDDAAPSSAEAASQ